jgi:DNA primase
VRLTCVGDKTVQVAELREELSKRQLDTSGNKAELVERLTQAMAASDSPAKPEQPAAQPAEPAEPAEQKQEQKPTTKKEAAKNGKEQLVEAAEQPAETVETTAQEQRPAAKNEAKKGKKRKDPEEAQEPKEAAAAKPVEKTPGCKLFVGNLGKPANVTEAKVKQLFGASLAHAYSALDARVQPASELTRAEVRAGQHAQRAVSRCPR